MSFKSLSAVSLVLLTGLLIGAGAPRAAPSSTSLNVKHSALTRAGVVAAGENAGAHESQVRMKPQTSVALLQRQASETGAHAVGSTIRLTFGLKLHHVSELKAFLQRVQNPASPDYHHFLTPVRFAQKYGPTKADVAAVTAFLKSYGIKVRSVSPNRLLIHTEAPTSHYEHALSIRIDDYEMNGRSFFSTTDRPLLPRAVSRRVQTIMGLNNAVLFHPMSRFESVQAAGQGGQASSFPPPANPGGAFSPAQIATAYDWPDIKDKHNGKGVTIAILTAESSDLDAEDYDNFWNTYDLPEHSVTVVSLGDSTATSGTLETLLDIEWSGALAPGAKQLVYVAPDATLGAFVDMYNRFVTDDKAQVMSTSWGADESAAPDLYATADAIFMQGAAEGISMFASAGDYGSSDCNPQGFCPPGNSNAVYPSSSPYVTAANGTELTLDADGNYGSEKAWSQSGGAVSKLFAQPWWQAGPGVADSGKRMNSDLALNATGDWALANSIWQWTAGTSLVAPQLAALFAIGVSQQPGKASLGQSNVLIYRDANLHYSTDFHDVTSGSNGAYQAAPDWDHPTGWGSPRATSFLSHLGVHGPAGTLSGTITDAASGDAVASATIHVGLGYAISEENGKYSVLLPAGTYTASVVDYGYQTATVQVKISDGRTTTRNFALEPAPKATISGKVSDASGHGYGLYANIQISAAHLGRVADVWTNPTTGEYRVSLPKGYPYTLSVTPAFDGYAPASAGIALDGDVTQNFLLPITAACTAPGYGFTGLGEDFNGPDFPPEGWTVTNAVAGSPVLWKANSAWQDDNMTGGSGEAADANSSKAYPYTGYFDTSLVTPPVPATRVRIDPTLNYRAAYSNFLGHDSLDLDISSDGGKTWANILHWNKSHGDTGGGVPVSVDLTPYLPSKGDIQLRWRYYDLTNGWDFQAEVDDIRIGACKPLSGGLVFGQVTDANNGKGIVGAEVTGDEGARATTIVNASDSGFPVGGYLMFLPSGRRTLTATDGNYESDSASLTVKDNRIVTRNFVLEAGSVKATPGQLDLDVPVNGQKQAQIELSNRGSIAATYRIYSINNPPFLAPVGGSGGAPLITIKGHFKGASLPSAMARGVSSGQVYGVDPLQAGAVPGSPWLALASLPVAVYHNAGAADPATGKVYSVGGSSGGEILKSVYVYDPVTNSWSSTADMEHPREAPVARFLDGKLYVVNGWNLHGYPTPELGIYDPAADTWSEGPANPVPAGGGSASAVVDGKLYVVGGCTNGDCEYISSAVEVYDPATKSWSAAADYPHRVEFAACGGIAGKLYCAGGIGVLTSGSTTVSKTFNEGYVYDPATGKWSPIAPIPLAHLGLWGASYSAAMGELIISGGIEGLETLSNAGYAYDPRSNSWSSLPNEPVPTYVGGSACGLYSFGGITLIPSFPRPQQAVVANAQLLPGYNACGTTPSIPWLTLAPASGTLGVGVSASPELTVDGSGHRPYTTSQAYLEVTGNTPYAMQIVPITVHWDPEPVNLMLSGSAAPSPIGKGNTLVYTLTVENGKEAGHGAASGVELTYALPAGAGYVSASGEGASCAVPSAGSSLAPAATTGATGIVTCDLGSLARGASRTVTIAVKAEQAGTLAGHFGLGARAPNDSGKNALDLETTVIGTADLSASASGATITEGDSGKVQLVVTNAGPDPATGVQVNVNAGGNVNLKGVTSGQGSCTASNKGTYSCAVGKVEAGGKVQVTLTVFGLSAGPATVQGQVVTSADDPHLSNNVATATVTVKAAGHGGGGNDNGGGGGALDWLALAVLLGFAGTAGCLRRKRILR